MSSVKVAVRVRPFNSREIALNCENVVQMYGQKTILSRDPAQLISTPILGKAQPHEEELKKEFTFDKSYWSFDKNDDNFASQEIVFEDLGKDIVKDAIEGYNSCIFAYGQTGSGKTHTMMGDQQSEGLIPRICRWLFMQMHELEKENTNVKYKTEISYLEIYNEHVRDLLDNSIQNNSATKKSLKVREHPKHGPYVEDLSKHMVYGYQDIYDLMMKGNMKRTTASTGMNDSSSRSHAIFTIFFSRATYIEGNPYETISKINLVDLAGSERANSTNAQGVRLVEGSHINKSLVTLGSVISHLADSYKKSGHSTNKTLTHNKTFVPYRDSILTWLLKDSLGGNSKTVMIATISPANVNFAETLNTLRYANRAKNIMNKPHINEDPNTKLIRELRAEIERLNSMMKQQVVDIENDENDKLKKETQVLGKILHQNEEKVKELTTEWMNKWQDLKNILKEQDYIALRKTGNSGVLLDSDRPHLIVCLDDDVLSTGVKLYHLNVGQTRIGTEHAAIKQDIILKCNDEINDEHCIIEWNVDCDNEVFLCPINNSKCRINSQLIHGRTPLHQGCFVAFGDNMFRFNNPHEVKTLKEKNNTSVDSSLFHNHNSPINTAQQRKALFRSFTLSSSSHLNGSNNSLICSSNDKQLKRQSLIEDLESTIAESKFEKICDDLSFLKLFILELEYSLQQTDKNLSFTTDNEDNNGKEVVNSCTSMVESFLELLVRIGKQGQFPKEKILEMLTFINTLNVKSNEETLEKVGNYLYEKMLSVKSEIKEEMLSITVGDMEISVDDCGIEMKGSGGGSANNEYHQKLFELNNEVDGSLANLFTCLPMMTKNSHFYDHLLIANDSETDNDDGHRVISSTPGIDTTATEGAVVRTETAIETVAPAANTTTTTLTMTNSLSDDSNDSLKNALRCSPIRSMSETSLEEIIENEVQRRVNVHLREIQALNDNFTAASSLCSTPKFVRSIVDIDKIPDNDTFSATGSSLFGSSIMIENSHHDNEILLSPADLLNDCSNENLPTSEDLNEVFIHIPAFHLVYEPKQHYVYEIRIQINNDKWTIFRRYSAFLKLNEFIKERYSDRIEVPYFPPKKWKNMNEKVIETRRRYLENYLQQLIDRCKRIPRSPLNHCAMSLPQINRQCLYNFNTFFRISPMSDKNEQQR